MYRKTKICFLGLIIAGLLLALSLPSAPAEVAATGPRMLVPCGNAIGVKIETDGVLVIGVSEFETKPDSMVNPSADAKIKQGDVINAVDGRIIRNMDDLREAVQQSGGQPMQVSLSRGEKELTVTVTPEKSNIDNSYYIGAWVRDSTAGIGTMTYYDPATGNFGALGHAICDMDTNDILQVYQGEVLTASITAVKQGEAGSPGELRGIFGEAAGWITVNHKNGIFGTLTNEALLPQRQAVPVAGRNEVKEGKAEILCCVNGTEISSYEIEIQKVSPFPKQLTRDMIIKITDPDLIQVTGGIIQGMSGSPILQDGKLVGAVTHVLVNDPTRGYGILMDHMLAEADKGES